MVERRASVAKSRLVVAALLLGIAVHAFFAGHITWCHYRECITATSASYQVLYWGAVIFFCLAWLWELAQAFFVFPRYESWRLGLEENGARSNAQMEMRPLWQKLFLFGVVPLAVVIAALLLLARLGP